MKFLASRKTTFALLIGILVLSACSLPDRNDPFERLPQETLETIYGELFPFSVSVSTRATHRLERDNKLVGYLTSDIVRLEDFEGQMVELEGVWRNEKMREIFWVESVKVAGGGKEEAPTEMRFATKNFTFLYPANWDYTESPDDKLFFIDKKDPNRRVFLTLAVEPFSPEAERVDPNIVLGNIAGNKEVITKENGRDQEVISLFSNDGTQQYVFKADYAFEDFDKKRALLDLLESFVEGENQVALVIEGEKIKKAEEESVKAQESADQAQLKAKANLVDEIAGDSPSFLDRLLSRGDSTEIVTTEPEQEDEEVDEVEVVKEAIQEEIKKESVKDFKNLIDARSYSYTSGAFSFSVKVPYNHWYQNFGAVGGNLFELGVANNPINGRATVDFWLRGKTQTPPADTTVELDEETLTITKKRSETSVFIMTGPASQKDAMWSVLESVQN